uniref:Uncharacterized protein n=1 Tax=Anguilla anguilla TaxID=7936 RepID=A0A0E9XZ57_ANGAN
MCTLRCEIFGFGCFVYIWYNCFAHCTKWLIIQQSKVMSAIFTFACKSRGGGSDALS